VVADGPFVPGTDPAARSKEPSMDHETKLAELMKQAEEQKRELERLMPQILALGDVEISVPFERIEAIWRPTSSTVLSIPNCALRA